MIGGPSAPDTNHALRQERTMRREDVINELVEAEWESLADDSKALSQFLRDVLRYGVSGFEEHHNATLEHLYQARFDVAITIADDSND